MSFDNDNSYYGKRVYDLEDVPDSKFLGPGKHIVRVASVRFFPANGEKKPYERFTLMDKNGSEINLILAATKAALFKMKEFATACGYDMAHAKGFEPIHLIDSFVTVTVKKDGKYAEVVEFEPAPADGWASLGAEPAAAKRPAASAASNGRPAAPSLHADAAFAPEYPDDEIPFG